MDKPRTTPRDFFLWAGAMIALYASVFSLVTLFFNYLDYAFPDPLQYLPDPYQSGISYEMASLIVLVPLFLVLMRIVRRTIEKDPSRAEIWVRRWALVLTLFIAGATVAIDIIVLLNTFLSGAELTTRFLLKILVVFLIAGAAFLHFLADIRGYWAKNPLRAQMVGWGAGILVLCSIVAGFFIVGTPQHARLMRLDAQKVSDLQSIQSQITYFFQQKRALPNTLSQLQDPLLGFTVPADPQSGAGYEYEKTADLAFRLCADFNYEGKPLNQRAVAPEASPYGKYVADNWEHPAGRYCFERAIDPAFFPPTTTTK